jgi:hypothetical protein
MVDLEQANASRKPGAHHVEARADEDDLTEPVVHRLLEVAADRVLSQSVVGDESGRNDTLDPAAYAPENRPGHSVQRMTQEWKGGAYGGFDRREAPAINEVPELVIVSQEEKS